MRLLAALMLFASIPAQAAVWEIDDAGAMVRLDTPPVVAVAPVATQRRTSASSRAHARQFSSPAPARNTRSVPR